MKASQMKVSQLKTNNLIKKYMRPGNYKVKCVVCEGAITAEGQDRHAVCTKLEKRGWSFEDGIEGIEPACPHCCYEVGESPFSNTIEFNS